MIEQNHTFSNHQSGEQVERIGNTWMSKGEKEYRMKWYEESMKNFDFDHAICPKCNNFTFFGIIHKEKGWQYYHCGCGFQAHREIKLNVSDKARDNERPSVSKQDLHTYVTVQCKRCGCDITVNMRQAYRGRKYCKSCIPHATRERQMGKKKGIQADVA
jgi:ribosomal protein S27AE